ncbi:MAG: YciI family protein [Terrimesophilobacter sp.]
MKFMIMMFSEPSDLHAKTTDWVERMTAFMVRLDDELSQSGELVYAEVLEFGESARLVDRHGGVHVGTFSGTTKPLSRFWVVKVPDESRAGAIAASIAEVVEAAVEVRKVLEASHRP